MNREMRRLQAREERRNKAAEAEKRPPGRQASKQKSDLPIHKRLLKFLKEVRIELQRVSWPTREQMIAFTTVTLITTIALTGFVFLLDLGFREGVFSLLELLQ
ncbi:MAG: preprotein translocase subunit SecE [Acidimicrobiia bacterium]